MANDPILTRRQREVLAMLGSGLGNRQIAERLGVTEGTVKDHLSEIYRRLGVRNRTEAVTTAHRSGLTSAGRPRVSS